MAGVAAERVPPSAVVGAAAVGVAAEREGLNMVADSGAVSRPVGPRADPSPPAWRWGLIAPVPIADEVPAQAEQDDRAQAEQDDRAQVPRGRRRRGQHGTTEARPRVAAEDLGQLRAAPEGLVRLIGRPQPPRTLAELARVPTMAPWTALDADPVPTVVMPAGDTTKPAHVPAPANAALSRLEKIPHDDRERITSGRTFATLKP